MTKLERRTQILGQLCDLILKIKINHPVRVAIDGVDAAGKTSLADELANVFRQVEKTVIRVSIDDFQRPRSERYQRGNLSSEGYYYDSFDYKAIIEHVLKPLGPSGNRRYKKSAFDFRLDAPIIEPLRLAPKDAVLLVDGVFLQRPELISYWDFRIFICVDFEEVLRRAIKRDLDLFGSTEYIIQRYRERYIPAQKVYYKTADPLDQADVLIYNNNPAQPELILVNKL